MRWFLPWAAVLAALAAGVPPAAAEPGGVRAVALPTRRDPDSLRQQARSAAAALARRSQRAVVPADADDDLADELRRGRELAASGALDAAARVLDPALAAAAASPQRIGDPQAFIAATLTRVSIALARGEDARGDALLERLLHYDPGFALAAAERSPRMQRALARVRQRVGTDPSLPVALLGDACAGAAVVVVARALADGSTELSRFDGCRLVARTRATARSRADALAAALDPLAAPPGDGAFYREPWFWASAAAVVAAGSAALYFGLRDQAELQVVPVL